MAVLAEPGTHPGLERRSARRPAVDAVPATGRSAGGLAPLRVPARVARAARAEMVGGWELFRAAGRFPALAGRDSGTMRPLRTRPLDPEFRDSGGHSRPARGFDPPGTPDAAAPQPGPRLGLPA